MGNSVKSRKVSESTKIPEKWSIRYMQQRSSYRVCNSAIRNNWYGTVRQILQVTKAVFNSGSGERKYNSTLQGNVNTYSVFLLPNPAKKVTSYKLATELWSFQDFMWRVYQMQRPFWSAEADTFSKTDELNKVGTAGGWNQGGTAANANGADRHCTALEVVQWKIGIVGRPWK